MLHILLGKHHFAKQSYIDDLATKKSVVVTRYINETLPHLENLTQPSLFSKPGIVVLDGCLNKVEVMEFIPTLIESKDIFVIVEEKVDKRKTEITKLLKLPNVVVKEFPVPHGSALAEWVSNHAKELGSSITQPAANLLMRLLGGESTDPRFEVDMDLWQIHNELKKLAVYADGKEITEDMVSVLVRNVAVPQVWDIVDAVGKRQPALVLATMQKYLESDSSTDDKAKIIQLNALLADQFRSLLLVKSAQNIGMPDDIVLDKTGWKSGRLFVMKKLSAPFEEKSLVATLGKLEALDVELKTGSVPPKVLLDLICSQIA